MSGLAKRLGVRHSALYNYFPSKRDLVAALVEEHARGVTLPPRDGGPWQEWLSAAYGAVRVFIAETLAAEGYVVSTPRNLVVHAAITETLLEAGFTPAQTWDAVLRMVGTCIAAITYTRRIERFGPLTSDDWHDFVPDESPAAALATAIEEFDFDAWFERQVAIDIAALEQQLVGGRTAPMTTISREGKRR
jgi:AcrR family transcriptional regulator